MVYVYTSAICVEPQYTTAIICLICCISLILYLYIVNSIKQAAKNTRTLCTIANAIIIATLYSTIIIMLVTLT